MLLPHHSSLQHAPLSKISDPSRPIVNLTLPDTSLSFVLYHLSAGAMSCSPRARVNNGVKYELQQDRKGPDVKASSPPRESGCVFYSKCSCRVEIFIKRMAFSRRFQFSVLHITFFGLRDSQRETGSFSRGETCSVHHTTSVKVRVGFRHSLVVAVVRVCACVCVRLAANARILC